MNEREEMILKNKLSEYLKANFIFEGKNDLIEQKRKEYVSDIYEIFYPPEKLSTV